MPELQATSQAKTVASTKPATKPKTEENKKDTPQFSEVLDEKSTTLDKQREIERQNQQDPQAKDAEAAAKLGVGLNPTLANPALQIPGIDNKSKDTIRTDGFTDKNPQSMLI